MKNLSMNQLQAIASSCSEYNPMEKQFTSAVGNNSSTCQNCSHYVNKKCNLDLIDEILPNIENR